MNKKIQEQVLKYVLKDEDKNIWKHHTRDDVDELIKKAISRTSELEKANFKKKIEDFFKGQKISLKKNNTILPKEIVDYTDKILIVLKQQLLSKLDDNKEAEK